MSIMLGDRWVKHLLEEESAIGRFGRTVRYSMYMVFRNVISTTQISPLIFKCLLYIEFIQIFYYSIHPSFTFLWTTSFLSTFQKATMYFQLNKTLEDLKSAVFLAIVYCAFALQLFTACLLVYCYRYSRIKLKETEDKMHGIPASAGTAEANQRNKPSEGFWTFSIKFLASYAMLLNSIGSIPLFNIFISTLICSTHTSTGIDLNCYTGIYFLHFSIAFIGILLLLGCIVLFHKLYVDFNPLSQLPFSSPRTNIYFYRTILKLFLPLYIAADPSGNYSKEFIVLLALAHTGILVIRYISNPFFHRGIQSTVCVLDCLLFWSGIVSFVCGTIDNSSIGLLYMIACAPFTVLTFEAFMHRRQLQILSKDPKHMKSAEELETYTYFLIDIVQNNHNPTDRITLEGIIISHSKSCEKSIETCNCKSLILDKDTENEFGRESLQYASKDQKATASSAAAATKQSSHDLDPQKKWYTFIRSILLDMLNRYPKNIHLRLISAHLLQGFLKNNFKALLELMEAETCKPRTSEEFAIYQCKQQIEGEIIEGDLLMLENNGIPVNSIIDFHNQLVVFESEIDSCVNFHLQFWNSLLASTLNVPKLISLGTKITTSIQSVTRSFESLQEINSNNLSSLSTYGHFLKEIINNEEEAEKVIEKARIIRRSLTSRFHLEHEKVKYADNTNACIMMISGNIDSIGQVTNTNNEIYRMLGYEKTEIIDANVNKLMPRIYADVHTSIVKGFLETSESKIIGYERNVMCKNKSGYIVASSLMAKVLPTLQEGIQMVGFLKEVDSIDSHLASEDTNTTQTPHYIIYREDNLHIQGVSQGCYSEFGIPAEIAQGDQHEFTIDMIIPEILNAESVLELRSPAGIIFTMDTSQLRNQFLVEFGEDSQDEIINEQNEKKRVNANKNLSNDSFEKHIENAGFFAQEESGILLPDSTGSFRFRSAKIRANLIEERTYPNGITVNVLKFYEIIEEEDMQPITYKTEVEIVLKQKSLRKFNTLRSEKTFQDNFDDSNDGFSIEEYELKQLKDFKQQISKQTVPQKIRLLTQLMLSIIFCLIALSCIEFINQIQDKLEASEGYDAINVSYTTPSILFNTNYNYLLVSMLSNYKLGINPASESPTSNPNEALGATYRQTLDEYLIKLQGNVFGFIKYQIRVDSRRGTDIVDPTITVKIKTLTGTIIEQEIHLADSIFLYLSQASTLKSTPIYNLVDRGTGTTANPGYLDTIAKNIYYVRQNGIMTFREHLILNADDIFDFYFSDMTDKLVIYRAIMIIAITITGLSQLIIIPVIFKVISTNNQVLSLFGFIPSREIQNLISQCEKFSSRFAAQKHHSSSLDQSTQKTQNNHHPNDTPNNANGKNIEDEEQYTTRKTEQKYTSFFDDTNRGPLVQGNNNLTGDLDFDTRHGGETPMNHHSKGHITTVANNLSTIAHALKSIQSPLNEKDSKRGNMFAHGIDLTDRKQLQAKAKDNEIESEIMESHIAQLLNSKDINNQKQVIFRFGFLSIVCIVSYVIKFNFDLTFTRNATQLTQHLQIAQLRPIYIKYLMLFTLEDILAINTGQLVNSNSQSLRELYKEFVYETEKSIASTLKSSFPSELNSYSSLFGSAQTQNVCTTITSISDITSCEDNFKGILKSGLQTAVISFILRLEDYLITFKDVYASYSSDPTNFSGTISSNQQKFRELFRSFFSDGTYGQLFENIQTQISLLQTTFDTLNEELQAGLVAFVKNETKIEIIVFCSFAVVVLSMFWFFWIPYLKGLSFQIWRTKGLLHMIPTSIISKNEQMKQFMQKNIIPAIQ